LEKQYDQHERNGSDRGGRRKSASESGVRSTAEHNAGRAPHSTAEHNFRNAPHSTAGNNAGRARYSPAGNNAGRARYSPAEHNFRNAPHSAAEMVANNCQLAILPGAFVTFFLLYYYAIFKEETLPDRIAVLAGIATAFVLNSLLTIWFYKTDKLLAEQQLWRIPELSLHIWELFCGWPGALFAQRKYRHKWKKTSYMVAFWLCVLLNVAAVLGAAFPDISLPLLQNANDALMRLRDSIITIINNLKPQS